MAPVKVFGSAVFANAARVMACLEEVGVEYEVVEVDYTAKEHKGPQHLSKNPFGKIPALQDGDLILFESRPIAKYILRKFKSSEVDLLKEGDIAGAAMVDVWAEVEAQQYYPALSPVVVECIIFPVMRGTTTDQKVVDESLDKLKKLLEVYEARLSEHKYLAGDFFSFADLNHFPFTFYFMATPYASVFDAYPRVKAWWQSIMSRPSIKKIAANMPTMF
ncbi:unnamed protein product [Miscanthus lutarioriparius]|uniref:glutathione transferase n=1 Tax=Miscanthus lutarioriparius TaxID=422564 RepID=A0A811P9U0_9POAL|nr:unnamed protein product [Miscanthus lutarioriparius]